ncbi:MAG: hypothetical protein RBR05_00165 [Candidatus Methanomethylophilaceae archaeon]|nr:hypothetical protein [Candidatus Methanomethylophilaceae archaeon]MDD3379208.1 hypothetical protein [Candidatus Methanomethylophilaceae archaeon]MDY0223800.1 hypothetical protein [Candidatus Methanomethylophilaceae archaeon]
MNVIANNSSETVIGTDTTSQGTVNETELTMPSLDMEITCRVIERPDKNYNVYVLGNDSPADYLIKQLTANTSSTSEISTQSEKKDLVIISDGWIKDNVTEAPIIINGLVDNGYIVTLYRTSIDWNQTDLSISYSDTATMTSVCIIGNNTKCYGVQCGSDQKAIQKTIAWTDYITSIDRVSALNATEDDSLETGMDSFYDYYSNSYVYRGTL